MILKDKYCYKCANQYTRKGCLFCFGGRHFKEIPKVDTSKFCIKKGEVVQREKGK